MKLENRKGLVRGVIKIKQDHGSFEEVAAYTYWFRHDEPNLEMKLNREIQELLRVYSKDRFRYAGASYYAEWMDYKG